MWNALKQLFYKSPLLKIKAALTKDPDQVIFATLNQEGAPPAKLLFFAGEQGHYLDPLKVGYINIGNYDDNGIGVCDFTQDPKESLSWDGKMVALKPPPHHNPLAVVAANAYNHCPKGMRVPLWVDPKGRVWYFTGSSNYQTRSRFGNSFNLFRDKVDGDSGHGGRIMHFMTAFADFYPGTLIENATPVYDPDYYVQVYEKDIDTSAVHKIEKKYPPHVQMAVMLKAIERLSAYLNIPQPELHEMNEFQRQALEVAERQKRQAIDDIKVHYRPRV